MDVTEAVEAIWSGHRDGLHHPAAMRGRLDIATAYQVQLGLLDRYIEAGHRHVGWKVGLTAKAMQQQQGLDEPVLGFLLESGHRRSGVVLDCGSLIEPAFENELCITMGATLRGPGVTRPEAHEAIGAVSPALEVVERRGDAAGDLPLAIADNVQQRAFVTGAERGLEDSDLAAVTVEVRVNGDLVDRARGDAVLGSPELSIIWLANKLAEFGRPLEAGMRVMSGSFTRQHRVAAGDRVEARFEPFGTVTATFR